MMKNELFYIGCAIILGSLVRERDTPSVAIDIMRCNGITLKNLQDAGVDEFDLKPIRAAWYEVFRYSD